MLFENKVILDMNIRYETHDRLIADCESSILIIRLTFVAWICGVEQVTVVNLVKNNHFAVLTDCDLLLIEYVHKFNDVQKLKLQCKWHSKDVMPNKNQITQNKSPN